MNKSDVARLLGMGEHELGDPEDTPGGVVVDSLIDKNRYIIVPEDRPDAEGKTGVMFLAAPAVALGYNGGFPVFANFGGDAGEAEAAEQPKRSKRSKASDAEQPAGANAEQPAGANAGAES